MFFDPLTTGITVLFGNIVQLINEKTNNGEADEIKKKTARFHNESINNELRKKLTEDVRVLADTDLDYIEMLLKSKKKLVCFDGVHGEFHIDSDVKEKIQELRREAIKELKDEAEMLLNECLPTSPWNLADWQIEEKKEEAKLILKKVSEIQHRIDENIF